MKTEYSDIPDLLAARGLLPADPLALYLCGSMARGWGNAGSDIDVVSVVRRPWASPSAGEVKVPLDPGQVPFETMQVDGQQLEVKYWQEHQILQVLAKVSWEAHSSACAVHERLAQVEENLLGRLLACLPIIGEGWIASLHERIRASAFKTIVVDRALESAQEASFDARGQLGAGDVHSAILSTRIAFGHSVDALTLSRGEFDRSVKWRARRVREIAWPSLPFDLYWTVETMAELPARAPAAWISSTLDLCDSIAHEVRAAADEPD